MTVEQAKAELRASLREARQRRTAADIALDGARLRNVLLAEAEVQAAAVVAAYAAVGTEPPTQTLLDALVSQGTRVLLPVWTADGDLDWGWYARADALVDGARGLREPAGPYAGVSAIGQAAVVLTPALAVGRTGARLGRGGGAYDRALPRATGLTIALVYEDELLPSVPTAPHDVPVAAAATPTRLLRFG